MEKRNRRSFITTTGIGITIGTAISGLIENGSRSLATPTSTNVDKFTPYSPQPEPEKMTELEFFMESIKPKMDAALDAARRFDIYRGLKEGITEEQRVEDVRRYYPVYCGASAKYGIGRVPLWMIHLDETAISRDPNPGRFGFTGAMQRSGKLYSHQEAAEALEGWEFLAEREDVYRYHDPVGSSMRSSDPHEIFWAARYIRQRVEPIRHRFESDYAAQLYVLKYNYSDPKHGIPREQWVRHISGVLD